MSPLLNNDKTWTFWLSAQVSDRRQPICCAPECAGRSCAEPIDAGVIQAILLCKNSCRLPRSCLSLAVLHGEAGSKWSKRDIRTQTNSHAQLEIAPGQGARIRARRHRYKGLWVSVVCVGPQLRFRILDILGLAFEVATS